jgi:diguanylate cyclase (GGDEF)-like protein
MNGSVEPRPRALIVDDEPLVRSVVREILCESCECSEASSAEEALELLRAHSFDLVLSDINMGGMSGLEMIPHALASSPDTVVMMISGEQTIESAIEAMRLGAFDYIQKPFDLKHVEAAARRALKHHALLVSKRLHENHLEELVKQRTLELRHLAYHDTLTSLPNRLLFEDRLTQALTLARHDGRMVGVLSLSLDRFKKINDTLGHTEGDLLLMEVAARLSVCAGEGVTVARFEGEEFALLLTQAADTDDLLALVGRVNESLRSPLNIGRQEIFITASVGISLYPNDGDDAPTLLKNAGAALYRAKEYGGNNYQFYTSDMNARALKRLALENSMRRALGREEFEVYYQPRVDVSTGRIVGAEALVRWRHKEFGLISPAEFIPLAEDTGLIVPIGAWVLRAACARAKSWRDAGHGEVPVAVNLSARQFREPNLPATIAQILSETGLGPQDLELELTESSIIQNAEAAVRYLGELRETGIRVAVDDFGTGYSSLGYLKRLPIDMLKIDQSFVRDVTTDADDAALVMAIITLAHNLRLKVVAEGVETEEQLRFLSLLHCDEWQGYLCSKPLPAEAFEEMLSSHAQFKDFGETRRKSKP